MGIPFPQALSSDQPAAAPLPSIFKTQLSRSASVSRVGSSLIVLREQELLLKNPTKSVKPRVVHTPPPKFYRCSRLRSNTKLFAAMTPDLAAAVAAHARRSRGGYQEFVHQLTQNARQSGTPMRFRHFACAAAAQWRGMSAESRQPFFISAVDSNTSWLQERVMLEARLKQAGHPFLPWDKVSLQPASTPSYLLVKERRAQTKKRQPPEHTQPSVLTEQLAASHSAMCAPSPALPPAQQQLLWQEVSKLAGFSAPPQSRQSKAGQRTRPVAPYFHFSKDVYHAVAKACTTSAADPAKVVSRMWQELPVELQQRYKDLSAREWASMQPAEQGRHFRAQTPPRPPRPQVPYFRFMKGVYHSVAARFPPFTAAPAVAREIGRLWREMSEEQKRPYQAAYDEEAQQQARQALEQQRRLPLVAVEE
ncbi:MAG: hypothetical protein WDW36_007076 [Sanguina aurantia]